MKTVKIIEKILIIFVISICIYNVILPQYEVQASVKDEIAGIEEKEPETPDDLKETIGRVLGFIQVAAGLMSVLMIAFTGFSYILAENAEIKSELKKKMLPMVIGLVCVFGAVSIATFIVGGIEGTVS